MNYTILADYFSVLSDIREFRQYQHRVVNRAMRLYVLNPINIIRDYRVIWSPGKDIDFLVGTTDPTILHILAQLSSSTERQSRWWPILIADRSTDALSIYLRAQHQTADFNLLNKLHQAKGKVLSRNNPKAPIAFVLAAATAIIKATPKSIIEGSWGIAYTTFEESIFWWMIALSVFFLLFMTPAWLGVKGARGLFDYAAYMFDYLDLTTSRDTI
jgi:hypothetical protein